MITNLQDAKALYKMGAPLNSLVVHREFSLAFDKCENRLVYAQLRFLNTVFRYARGKGSVYKRRQVGRRLDDKFVAATLLQTDSVTQTDPISKLS